MTNDQYGQPGQSCPDDRWPADGRLAVDVVVFTCWTGVPALLVVERAKEPFADALALPGGFVWPRESTRDAAARELAEEAGVEIGPGRLHRLGRYDEAERDPRGVVVSVAYYGYALGAPAVTSGSDARAAR
nr:NUDIX domain-containing protein [Micromonospora sp. DSM 115978]